MIPPRLALLAWFPISFYFFWRYPIRTAILINFLGGWALLPTASYTPTSADFPYWILSSALSTDYFLTKATVIGASCLLGVWFVDRRFYRRFALSFWDLPMVAWCTVPLFSGVANPGVLDQGLRGEAYQLLAWGVPYFFGRVYFSDTDSLRLAAKALVIAGLAYVPVCLVEVFTGPQLYTRLYGYQPYRWTEAHRYFGFRPIGLLENGNQLGIWMATSALIAVWLWRCRSVDRVLKLPIACVAALLFAVTILCQSGGSILLLFGLLPFIFVSQRYLPRVVTVLLVVGILFFAGLRLTNVVSLQTLVAQNPRCACGRSIPTKDQTRLPDLAPGAGRGPCRHGTQKPGPGIRRMGLVARRSHAAVGVVDARLWHVWFLWIDRARVLATASCSMRRLVPPRPLGHRSVQPPSRVGCGDPHVGDR